MKKCIPKGEYQQRKGVRSQQVIPTDKIQGFRKFDKVEYRGTVFFIKGRMSTGYAKLMGIDGAEVKLKTMARLAQLKRVNARKSQIVMEIPIHLAPKGASILGRSG
ncbi:MAG: HNH endonuclease [Promethearchaeota archaeon]|nr:MAG: HNH endonuclease [Candidatus Lokiarchaeota archaeon]